MDWNLIQESLPILAKAALVTIEATFTAYAIALVLGLIFALLQRSKSRWISTPVREFVEFIRSTPVLVQIFFIFFVGPQIGVVIPAWTAGMLALGLHYASYTSEVYRAGLDGVPAGQWEASIALNLSRFRTYRDIILPQAIPPVIPALGNYLIGMFKETPLLAAISILELLATAQNIGSENFSYLEPITLVGAFFLVMSLLSSWFVQWLDARLNRPKGR